MKVSMWYNNRDIRIEEAPTPEPGPHEILVKVHSCGICGSDIEEWYRLPRAPLVQGHEIGAEVAAVGDSVSRYEPGDRVFIAPKVPCMDCYYCRNGHYPQCSVVKERLPGGFAEYVLAPEILVEKGTYPLPDAITYDQSTFIEPLACVTRAQRLAGLEEGHTVLIIGSGMSGLLHVKLAKSKGCTVYVADIARQRLETAERMGADVVLDGNESAAERLLAENGRGADVVMLCTSALPGVEQAWKAVDKGGAIVFFAVPDPEKKVIVPINSLWTREIRIATSYYCGPPDIVDAMKLLETGAIEVDDLITHRLPLDEIETGFRHVVEGKDSLKVIIKPHEEGK